MSSIRNAPTKQNVLTPKQRLALCHGTNIAASVLLNMQDNEITFAYLAEHKIPLSNLAAADVGPVILKQRGAADASDLVRIGHDALHLVDQVFCEGAVAAFGAASVVDAFIVSPLDAVSVAGSSAVARLGLSTQALLETCAGASIEAFAVLKVQSPAGLRTSTLLDTGLRQKQLAELGWTADTVRELVGTSAELKKLGY